VKADVLVFAGGTIGLVAAASPGDPKAKAGCCVPPAFVYVYEVGLQELPVPP